MGVSPEREEPVRVEPVDGPLDATVTVPGSKSLTNRALVCAALAEGHSRLSGLLVADDTEAMTDCLGRLGIAVSRPATAAADELDVEGCGGVLPDAAVGARLDARLSGTTSRFLLPVLALGPGPTRLDGAPPLRARPMADGIVALSQLDAKVVEEGEAGRLPVTVRGPGPRAGRPPSQPVLRVAGDASSQFLSGLLMAAPARRGGLRLQVEGGLVSRPYVDMTVAVMRAFGASVTELVEGAEKNWTVAGDLYRAADYHIEPDASAASYFFAAAAILGGRVTVEHLGRESLQGDLRFVEVLEAMGCTVHRGTESTTVESSGELHGVDVDLGDLSDTAQTLAVVAVFASSPSRVRGIGFIRNKETDRVGNVVTELRRCGIDAREEPDGFVVPPGTPRPATVQTYDDHRMAMSFALLGLRAPGIEIADPGCVAKTFPSYWDALDQLRH